MNQKKKKDFKKMPNYEEKKQRTPKKQKKDFQTTFLKFQNLCNEQEKNYDEKKVQKRKMCTKR